jgi:hypothetical protein
MASGFLLVLKPIKANPTKSNRAIGAELVVDHKTVGNSPSVSWGVSPTDERIGRDGKPYSIRQRITDDCIMRKIPSLGQTRDACGS